MELTYPTNGKGKSSSWMGYVSFRGGRHRPFFLDLKCVNACKKLRWIQHTPNCQTKQIDIFKEVTSKETSKLLVSGSLFSGAVGGWLVGGPLREPHQPNKHSGSALCTFRLRMLAFFVVLGEMIEFHYSNTSSKGLKPTKYNSRSSTLHRKPAVQREQINMPIVRSISGSFCHFHHLQAKKKPRLISAGTQAMNHDVCQSVRFDSRFFLT